jgi:alkylated DNA repair dioxygenase AlkB
MQIELFKSFDSEVSNTRTLPVMMQQDKVKKIDGLLYIQNFIDEKEEVDLFHAINKEHWMTSIRRRVQHYGWKYDYKARTIDYSMYLGDLPAWAKPYAERLCSQGLLTRMPDQIIVNEYQPGQGIANHVDCEPCFGETIISLSLGSTAIMDFINLKTKEKIDLFIEQRSLVALNGAARHKWSHGIPARKTDVFEDIKFDRSLRVSLTFRNVIIKDSLKV